MPALLDRILGRSRAAAIPPGADPQPAAAPPPDPPEAGRPARDPPAPPPAPLAAPRRDRAPAPAEAALRGALATKLLHAWAENRQQVRVPLSLDLRAMPPGARGLVVQALAAAVAADGRRDPAETARLRATLRRIGGTAEDLDAAACPPDLFALLAALEEAGCGAHGYAAAALVLDARVAANRGFLAWLAARLGVPEALATGIARRYRR